MIHAPALTLFSPKMGISAVLESCLTSHEELQLSRTGGFLFVCLFVPWKDHLTSGDF